MAKARDEITIRQFTDTDVGATAFEVVGDPLRERHYDWFEAMRSFLRRFDMRSAVVRGKVEK